VTGSTRPRLGSSTWPDWEDAGEEVGEDAERSEPCAYQHQNVPGPSLDSWSSCPDPLRHALLRERDEERRREGQHDDRGRSNGVGGEGRSEASRRQCLPRQTGEDRTGSAESDDQVGEPEGREPGDRMLATEARLPLQDRPGQSFDSVKGDWHDLRLDQPEDDE